LRLTVSLETQVFKDYPVETDVSQDIWLELTILFVVLLPFSRREPRFDFDLNILFLGIVCGMNASRPIISHLLGKGKDIDSLEWQIFFSRA